MCACIEVSDNFKQCKQDMQASVRVRKHTYQSLHTYVHKPELHLSKNSCTQISLSLSLSFSLLLSRSLALSLSLSLSLTHTHLNSRTYPVLAHLNLVRTILGEEVSRALGQAAAQSTSLVSLRYARIKVQSSGFKV
jgi:hypothetical protein